MPEGLRHSFQAVLSISLLSLLLLTVGGVTVSIAQSTIDRISFTPRSDGQGHVVRFHTDRKIDAFTVQPATNYVELILFRSRLGASLRREAAEGAVSSYEIREDSDRVLVRFMLDRAVSAEAYHDRASNDLLFAVTEVSGPVVSALQPPAASSAAQEVRVEGSSSPSGSTPATYIEQGKKWRLDTIIIDAGHGGHDPGAVANGVREKDINLAIARKLGHYIEDRLGVKVVYTRQTDRFIELHERGRIANEAGGKLFISIHTNSVGGARARSAAGTETYFLGQHKTEEAKRVMERENAVIRFETDTEVYDQYNLDNLIYQSLALSTYMRESERLAALVESQFKNRAGRHSRGVKQAGLIVLFAASMPAVLVETGFITNPREAAFLASERGQDLIASAIFRAVREYKEAYEKGLDFALGD